MKVLSNGPEPRADRAATEILYDEANARIVGFSLNPGQQIAPHKSDSMVIIHVREGTGEFRGESGGEMLSAGQSAVFMPGETHAVNAGKSSLRFIAVIAPSPGS
jgi:quercetin dioxygenase-like cupin family protein